MSDFWVRKMKTNFQRIDFDKDGAITQKDFEGIAERFAKAQNLDEKRAAELHFILSRNWKKYAAMNVDDGRPVDQETYIANTRQQFNDPLVHQEIAELLGIIFKAIDANRDEVIELKEYELFFSIIDIDPKMAAATFKAIDTNNDGALSLDEFVTAGVDFFLSEDESSPNRLFWGPLVE